MPEQVVLSRSEVFLECNDPEHGVEQDDTEQYEAHPRFIDSLSPCEGILNLDSIKSMYQKYFNMIHLTFGFLYTEEKSPLAPVIGFTGRTEITNFYWIHNV